MKLVLLNGLLMIFFSHYASAMMLVHQDSSKKINIDSLIAIELAKQKIKNANHEGKLYPKLLGLSKATGINIKELKQKRIFINFWFAACHPCIEEFKGLNQLYKKVKNNHNIIFLSITFENNVRIKQVKKKYKLSYPILSLTEQDCRRLNLDNGYPTNIILADEGKIRKLYTGGYGSEQEATDFMLNKIYHDLINHN